MRRAAVLMIALAAGQPALAASISFRSQAAPTHAGLKLSDIADLAALPAWLRAPAADLAIAPPGSGDSILPVKDVESRLRSLMPALTPWLPSPAGEIEVHLQASPRLHSVGPACFQMHKSLEAGDVVTSADVVLTTCSPSPARKAFLYNAASGTARADRDLKAGEQVSGLPSEVLAAVAPGDPVYLTARVGHVLVERRAEAVQAAAARRGVFVKAEDGSVFAAPPPAPQ